MSEEELAALKRLEEAAGRLWDKMLAADTRQEEAELEAETLHDEWREANSAVVTKKKELGISEWVSSGALLRGQSLDPATAGLRRVVRRKGPIGC